MKSHSFSSVLIWHRDLSNKEFNSNDTRGPKSASAFIIKLSELAPRLVIKQMTLLVKQLDSEVSPKPCLETEYVNARRPILLDVQS